jgi:hypothetical protein
MFICILLLAGWLKRTHGCDGKSQADVSSVIRRLLPYFSNKKTTMRNILTLAIITTFWLAAFAGCKKSRSSTASYTLTATVGDSAFSGNDTYVVGTGISRAIFSYNGTGSSPMPPYMQIVIPNYTGAGTYNFDTTLVTNFALYQSTYTNRKLAKSGAVVISDTSGASVSGTFSFTATDGTVVSSGKFTAKKE